MLLKKPSVAGRRTLHSDNLTGYDKVRGWTHISMISEIVTFDETKFQGKANHAFSTALLQRRLSGAIGTRSHKINF